MRQTFLASENVAQKLAFHLEAVFLQKFTCDYNLKTKIHTKVFALTIYNYQARSQDLEKGGGGGLF